MGKTFRVLMGTVKKVTEKSISGCCFMFSRMRKHIEPISSPCTMWWQQTIEEKPEANSVEIHPVQMMQILKDVFQDHKMADRYAKHLDKKDSGRFFCLTASSGARNCAQTWDQGGNKVLETPFQKLTDKAITPQRSTPESVGYDVFIPTNLILQPNEERTIYIDVGM